MKKYALITFFLLSNGLLAKEYEIKMLNKGSNGDKMVFEPSFLKVQVGDKIKFIPKNKGHSVESLKKKGASPDGEKAFKSKTNKEYILNIEKEGLYAFKCRPHYAMGMVGLVQAGKPLNIDQIKKIKLRGKAKKRMTKILFNVKWLINFFKNDSYYI